MTWAESVDEVKIIEKDDQKFEQVIKHVGPIWGQDEAEEKVNAFMAEHKMHDWTWTGAWNSEDGTSYAEFEKRVKTWAESVDQVKIVEKDGQKFKQVIKHVGPIWGQHEAEEKVNGFVAENEMSDWTWTGSWNSEDGTSYAELEKSVNTWAESVDGIQIVFKNNQKYELIVKDVGPIWGQDEAEEKVNAFMAENEMLDWTWTGQWNSEDGTSYAEFERKL